MTYVFEKNGIIARKIEYELDLLAVKAISYVGIRKK